MRSNVLFAGAGASRLKIKVYMLVPLYFVLWMGSLTAGRLFFYVVSSGLSQAFGVDEATEQAFRKIMVCAIQVVLFGLWIVLIEKRPLKSAGLHAVKPLKSAAEEVTVRGWLIPVLAKESSPAFAILLSSVIFGFFHLFSAGVTVLSFTNLILSGVFFAGYAILTKHIWGVCGMHFAWNVTLGNVYGFPVSGFSDNGPTLVKLSQTGPALFTGGAFGPEGGAVTTLVLLLGIIIVVKLWLKQQALPTSTN
ncbi:CPBP family intramembrane glutamic endopeptidase [Paenibacillus typhae]|uniref:CPBP family intramembrane glutamic endopeptidase n=1 Tax=Paenibacillus typhae TaxID=1174501 RepID=UPI001C8CFE90|nr:CPBP family intramembrane glutamic endopeptidase [Paenibacillus typhae]